MGKCSIIKVGDKFKTNHCGYCEVVEYKNSADVKIRFLDETNYIMDGIYAQALRNGSVKNPMHPSVHGIGFVGTGKYKQYLSAYVKSPEYTSWCSMLNRCYNPKVKEVRPTYDSAIVCKEWHNFQNFADWCNHQIGFNCGWHLDKDILIKGNKTYSPTTCVFVPQEINALFVKSNKVRGKYPIGVSFDKSKNIFTATMSKWGNFYKIGQFRTPDVAFAAYKKEKEAYIKEVATKFKEVVDHRVTLALMNYTVEEAD